MTSQNWRTLSEVSRTLWWHYVVVMIPKKVKQSTGFVWLAPDAGNNDVKDIPTQKSISVQMAGLIAVETNCVVTAIFQTPNQPLVFADDPSHKSRNQDSLLGWTWTEAVRAGNDNIQNAVFPMTKAVVRAMDTTTDQLHKKSNQPIDTFVVAGASKWG